MNQNHSDSLVSRLDFDPKEKIYFLKNHINKNTLQKIYKVFVGKEQFKYSLF
jgi:hypothetical protein